jgi:hypothetical protein
MLLKQKLHPVPCLLINDRIVKTIVGLALVCQGPQGAAVAAIGACGDYLFTAGSLTQSPA